MAKNAGITFVPKTMKARFQTQEAAERYLDECEKKAGAIYVTIRPMWNWLRGEEPVLVGFETTVSTLH